MPVYQAIIDGHDAGEPVGFPSLVPRLEAKGSLTVMIGGLSASGWARRLAMLLCRESVDRAQHEGEREALSPGARRAVR